MTCDADSRYDVVFRDVNTAGRSDGLCDLGKGDLPLMLVNGGGLGYSEGLVSPYGARLSQGDMTDADVSQFTNRTQHDWSGGRGQLDAYGATNRFVDGVADTRFKGRVISAPKRQQFVFGSAVSGVAGVNVVRFGEMLVTACGSKLFFWNGETDSWDMAADVGATVTDLAVFANRLYVARGKANSMKRTVNPLDLSALEDGYKQADYLLAYNGYLYTLIEDGILDYTNGTTWNGFIEIGGLANLFTQMVGFRNEIILIGARGLWSLSANIIYQVASYEQLAQATNGRNAITWVADGRLYLPLRNGLYAWDGSGLQAVGPEMEEGLPSAQRGVFSALVGTQRFLYGAIDAGAGMSGIYAMGRDGSWHTLALGEMGKPIRAMGLDTQEGLPRLWWFEEHTPCCAYISDDLADVDKPGFVYEDECEVVSSWIGAELRWIKKDIDRVLIHADNLLAGTRTLEVYLEYDRSGVWVNVGYADEPGYGYISIVAPALTAKTWGGVDGQGRVMLASGNTNDLTPGMFVRAGNTVIQVGQVVSATLFKPAHWIQQMPEIGDVIVGSRPVCYEVRYKAVLRTNDQSTPVVLHSVTVRYQDFLLELKRFTLQVLAQDNLADAQGGTYPLSASEVRARLKEWVYRATPFEMIAPTEERYKVKIGSVNESGFARDKGGLKSVCTVSLWQTER